MTRPTDDLADGMSRRSLLQQAGRGVSFTLLFTVASTAIQMVYAMGIALLLNSSFRGRGLV